MTSSATQISFLYKLLFEDGEMLEFPVHLDLATNNFISPVQQDLPFWTELGYEQCSNCPLSAATARLCPVAANLVPLLDLCSAMKSYSRVNVEVVTAERTLRCDTTMQRALSSMLGLIIATSPCPHAEYLKPMARFHLPFASADETIYRVVSMFLMAQYYLHQEGRESGLELDKLTQIYRELQIVNRALAKRLNAAISEDAGVNALILLDLLSQSVTWSIEDGIEEFRYLFKRYGVGGEA